MTANGSGGLAGLTPDELREAVRAVLRDVLPDLVADVPGLVADVTEAVVLHTDAELDAFVQRLLVLFEDPEQRAAVRAGRRRFRLGVGATGDREPVRDDSAVVRVERGAATERWVNEAATRGVRLVVGRAAVLTPLARDRARTLGVVVEKER